MKAILAATLEGEPPEAYFWEQSTVPPIAILTGPMQPKRVPDSILTILYLARIGLDIQEHSHGCLVILKNLAIVNDMTV